MPLKPLTHPVAGGMYSIGDLMLATGQPRHRVQYLLESRRIKPIDKIGGANVYDLAGFELLKEAIRAIDNRRVNLQMRTHVMA
jgi:hypothetical protein